MRVVSRTPSISCSSPSSRVVWTRTPSRAPSHDLRATPSKTTCHTSSRNCYSAPSPLFPAIRLLAPASLTRAARAKASWTSSASPARSRLSSTVGVRMARARLPTISSCMLRTMHPRPRSSAWRAATRITAIRGTTPVSISSTMPAPVRVLVCHLLTAMGGDLSAPRLRLADPTPRRTPCPAPSRRSSHSAPMAMRRPARSIRR